MKSTPKCPLMYWQDDIHGSPLQIVEAIPNLIRAANHECSKTLIPAWLMDQPFRIEYYPDRNFKFRVRLPGKGQKVIDGRSYVHVGKEPRTKDAVGFGMTVSEAATEARVCQQRSKK